MIKVNIQKQQLELSDETGKLLRVYPVSTSMYGTGSVEGSYQTPLGHHQVCEKYGDGCAEDEVFIGREPKGRLIELQHRDNDLPDDIITARILRLKGMQAGLNAGGDVDSYQRYIYIHGTPEEEKISQPVSHGCIRMRNQDIVELFELVKLNEDVFIEQN